MQRATKFLSVKICEICGKKYRAFEPLWHIIQSVKICDICGKKQRAKVKVQKQQIFYL
jgi:hypothetical protein